MTHLNSSVRMYLTTHDPSIEDISDRIVDGSQDGGVDSIFIYVNRVLVAEDTDSEISNFQSKSNSS